MTGCTVDVEPSVDPVVPILIAYIFLQRWIVGGLTAGATKG